MTPCECPLTGWCPRHKLHLTHTEQMLCRTDPRYFALFASGSSPQHFREAATNGQPFPIVGSEGFGDTLAWAIERITFGLVKPCGRCNRRRAWLNRLWPYRRRT